MEQRNEARLIRTNVRQLSVLIAKKCESMGIAWAMAKSGRSYIIERQICGLRI